MVACALVDGEASTMHTDDNSFHLNCQCGMFISGRHQALKCSSGHPQCPAILSGLALSWFVFHAFPFGSHLPLHGSCDLVQAGHGPCYR